MARQSSPPTGSRNPGVPLVGKELLREKKEYRTDTGGGGLLSTSITNNNNGGI